MLDRTLLNQTLNLQDDAQPLGECGLISGCASQVEFQKVFNIAREEVAEVCFVAPESNLVSKPANKPRGGRPKKKQMTLEESMNSQGNPNDESIGSLNSDLNNKASKKPRAPPRKKKEELKDLTSITKSMTSSNNRMVSKKQPAAKAFTA